MTDRPQKEIIAQDLDIKNKVLKDKRKSLIKVLKDKRPLMQLKTSQETYSSTIEDCLNKDLDLSPGKMYYAAGVLTK